MNMMLAGTATRTRDAGMRSAAAALGSMRTDSVFPAAGVGAGLSPVPVSRPPSRSSCSIASPIFSVIRRRLPTADYVIVENLGHPPVRRPGRVYSGRVNDDSAALLRHPAALIDHTLLKPAATAAAIDRLCDEAVEHGFVSVFVNPRWVPRAAVRLRGTGVAVCTVVGFPLGATTTAVKVFEARDALAAGADEIDAVIDIAAVKERDTGRLRAQLAALVAVVHGTAGAAIEDAFAGGVRGTGPTLIPDAQDAAVSPAHILKVIIEACLLTDDEIGYASRLVAESGADFVKTSTGFSTGGATVGAVRLIRAAVGPDLGVKAAGGIHTPQQLRDLVEAGATRIGASDGMALIQV